MDLLLSRINAYAAKFHEASESPLELEPSILLTYPGTTTATSALAPITSATHAPGQQADQWAPGLQLILEPKEWTAKLDRREYLRGMNDRWSEYITDCLEPHM